MDRPALDVEEIARQTGVSALRAGTGDDSILGVTPGVVASPTGVDEVSALLKWADERGLKVVPCGSRTKIDRGAAPAGYDISLEMGELKSIVEHAAGDMTVTVQAGVRLDDLQEALAKEKQFLPVDPPVQGTVGGLIATADSGALRLRYGGVRDLILGVTFVRANGVVARGGGRVVKNVAGYDLPKLLTGSLGTLGVIVEATFRLYPLPAASYSLVVDELQPREAGDVAQQILKSTVVPVALDYCIDSAGAKTILAARFFGSESAVQAQAVRARGLFTRPEAHMVTGRVEEARWGGFASIARTHDEDVLARLASTPSDLPGLLESATASAEHEATRLSVRSHLGFGHALLKWYEPEPGAVVRLLLKVREEAEQCGGNLVLWRAPSEVREQVDVWGDPGEGFALMRRVKEQFDPNNTLNPGRFVGGI